MNYILQLNTGAFDRPAMDIEDTLSKLSYAINRLHTSKVIFGWARDPKLNRKLCDFLKERSVQPWLWLPVFAEIQDFQKTRVNRPLRTSAAADINLFGDDTFEFACQSDRTAIDRAMETYEQLAEGCSFDGVFLDRIRYSSPAVSDAALYGCWCDSCRELYHRAGVRENAVKTLASKPALEQIRAFLPVSRSNGVYGYTDHDIDLLMAQKRKIITCQIETLCTYFRERGLALGADTFAPAIADYVGQDLYAIGAMVDFIKPMIYLRTEAPAGLPFELKGLGDEICSAIVGLWNRPGGAQTDPGAGCVQESLANMDACCVQLQELTKAGICVTPGIDANTVSGICSADPAYTASFVQSLLKSGFTQVVLSWDVTRISRETIDLLGTL